jgi:hypothetical protein
MWAGRDMTESVLFFFLLLLNVLLIVVVLLLSFNPIGISRDSRHKRRATGGRKANLKKKRLYESGRPGAMTKLGATRIHNIRTRGGNQKFRALRLDTGNFSWGSEGKHLRAATIHSSFFFI